MNIKHFITKGGEQMSETNTTLSPTPKKRGRPPKDKTVETNSVAQIKAENPQSELKQNEIYEYNTRGMSSYTLWGDYIDVPLSEKEIQTAIKDPMNNAPRLRNLAWWAYWSNGTITSAVDYIKSMHTLDCVVVCKTKTKSGKRPVNFEDNRLKMISVLDTIKYKEQIRDMLLKDANDGISFYYFETTNSNVSNKKFLSDVEVGNIVDINALGINASVIALPVDWCKIVGRRNSSFVMAFNLMYFQQFDGTDLPSKLKMYPKEIRDGWDLYSKNSTTGNWIVLDNNNTLVTKIKSAQNDPWGVPIAIAALDDILYADYFVNTKRSVLDDINNQIVYQTFPEGKDKGTSALTSKQQKDQHDTVKDAILTKRNQYGRSFFSLASGTKLEKLDVDIDIFDEKNETNIKDNVASDLGISSSSLNGSTKGNYATGTTNLELVSANIYTWIEAFVNELNKCINANIIKDNSCKVAMYVLPTTFSNRDKLVKYMADLYARGKGSLIAWIASTGFDPEAYLSLMDYELEMDLENKYPVHATSFTMTGKDELGADKDKSEGGRSKETNPTNPNTIKSQQTGGNKNPKPSA